MKKVVLVFFGVSFFAPVVAEDAVVIDSEIVRAQENSSFGNLYLGAGVGGSFLKTDLTAPQTAKSQADRFIGSVVFGGGKTFRDNYYVGGECLLDFAKTKTRPTSVGDVYIKTRGATPSLGVRIGYNYVPYNMMFYSKMSAVFPKSTVVRHEQEACSVSKCTPSFELGTEKAFGRFVTRAGVEYTLRAKKTVSVENINCTLKSGKGFNIRVLVLYSR